jgi:hypothetical protein
MKLRILVVLLLVNALLWGRAMAYGPTGIEIAEDEGRKGCAKKSLTLRALLVTYSEEGIPIKIQGACGLPRLTKA